jgi:hypothetical protein
MRARIAQSVKRLATALDGRGVGVRVPVFLLSTLFRPILGPSQPSVQWVLCALSPGVKRPVPEADHSFPTCAEVKNMWIYTASPPCLHGVVLNWLSTGTNFLHHIYISFIYTYIRYLGISLLADLLSVRFEVLTAVIIQSYTFRDVIPPDSTV